MFCTDMTKVKITTLSIITFYMLVAMHIYIPNMGGAGLQLPGNIIGWCAVLLVFFSTWCCFDCNSKLNVNYACLFFLTGTVLLFAPIFFPHNQLNQDGVARVLALLGGGILYFTFLQCRFTAKEKIFLLWVLLGAVLIETTLTLLQFFLFEDDNWMEFNVNSTRPYGIFQQVNVMASFSATGLAISVYLFLIKDKERKIFPAVNRSLCISDVFLLFLFLILPMTLVLLQSRIGYLGALLSCTLLLMTHYRRQKLCCWLVVVFICAGVINGIVLLLESDVTAISHSGSNSERLLILTQVWEMIKSKIWLGWGYGSFEYNFHHFLANKTQPISMSRITHPHNEFLFWWVEGGIIALVGMLTLFAGYLWLLFFAWRKDCLSLGALGLPIILHTMTEYPLYQSVAHLITLFLLLSFIDNGTEVKSEKFVTGVSWFSCVAKFSSLCALYFMIAGFKTGLVLTDLERGGLVSFSQARELYNPYINLSRYQFDEQVHNLILFNNTKDIRLLNEYLIWGERYSNSHVDKNVYLNMIKITQYLGMAEKVNLLTHQAHLLFNYDIEFTRRLNQIKRQ